MWAAVTCVACREERVLLAPHVLTLRWVFFAEEVARLMRDYAQNDQLVRNLGSRYYQVRTER